MRVSENHTTRLCSWLYVHDLPPAALQESVLLLAHVSFPPELWVARGGSQRWLPLPHPPWRTCLTNGTRSSFTFPSTWGGAWIWFKPGARGRWLS